MWAIWGPHLVFWGDFLVQMRIAKVDMLGRGVGSQQRGVEFKGGSSHD